MAHLSWTKFFSYKPLLLLSSTYWLFLLCDKKILTADPEFRGCTIFRPKMVHLPQTIFFWKIINTILTYLSAPFIVQNLKKFFQRIQSCGGMRNFWAQNGPFPQVRIFFSENLLMSLVSLIHAYRHAKNQSQILIYYWNIDD